MLAHSPFHELDAILQDLESRDNLRSLHTLERREGPYVWLRGQKYLNLSANDYLGLATDSILQQRFWEQWVSSRSSQDLGFSASSSRLLCGTFPQHADLEATLAQMYAREAALVFSSGFHANLALLPALLGPEDIVFSDRLNHASLLDGILLSKAKWHRYHHNQLDHLESLLRKYRAAGKKAVIVTESVFSMDGDCADLPGLVALKKKYDCWLYVDEAHALGVFGPQGLGWAEATQTMAEIDFLVGTFGKALAGLGAFVVSDSIAIRYLINTARPFIFSTALPPLMAAWLNFVFKLLPEWQTRRQHLLAVSGQLRNALQAAGQKVLGSSQIVPILIGNNAAALALARHAQTQGLLAFAIRPPTVAAGTSRLRLSVTADMTWEMLSSLPGTLRTFQEAKA